MQGNLRAANRRSNNLYRFLMKINILACNEEKFLFFGLFFTIVLRLEIYELSLLFVNGSYVNVTKL